MKKRRGKILQKMMAVLLSAVLLVEMFSGVVPTNVLAQEIGEMQETVSENTVESAEEEVTGEPVQELTEEQTTAEDKLTEEAIGEPTEGPAQEPAEEQTPSVEEEPTEEMTGEPAQEPAEKQTEENVISEDTTDENAKMPEEQSIAVYAAEEHIHNGITYEAWTATDSLPNTAGNYYLTENVVLSDPWKVPNGTTNLCLNGKTIEIMNSYNLGTITISSSSTLSMYDCTGCGQVIGIADIADTTNIVVSNNGTFYMYGGMITKGAMEGLRNMGVVYMYGGKISGNAISATYGFAGVYNLDGIFYMYGGEISGNMGVRGGVSNLGTFCMYGGEIRENIGCGVYNVKRNTNDQVGTLTIGGSAVITDNTDADGIANNVFLNNTNSNYQLKIDSDNPLTGSAPIGIRVKEKNTPTEGNPVSITGANSADYSSCFVSDDPNYTIVDGEDHKIQLIAQIQKHIHNDITYEAWTATDSLPTTAGNYYLTENVVLSDSWKVPNGTTNLCLNGKTIKTTIDKGETVSIQESSTLKLYDCIGNGKIIGNNTNVVGNTGTFYMYSGNITDGTIGGLDNNGIFYMYGGKISENNNSGRYGGVNNEGTFYMYGGEISGNKVIEGVGNVSGVNNEGTFHMYGGKISGNKVIEGDEGVGGVGGIANYGIFCMYGGEISGNTGSGLVTAEYNSVKGTVTIGGSAVITDNKNSSGEQSNVFLNTERRYLITIDSNNPLTGSAKIGVRTNTMPMEGFPVSITGANSADYSSYFVSDNPNYTIVDGEDHKIQLIAQTQKHIHDGVTYEAWTATDSLPTTAGNYYLTKDVSLSGVWSPDSGTTNLCLNGKTIKKTVDDRQAIINTLNSSLNLYDCMGNGEITGEAHVAVVNSYGCTFNVYGGKITSGWYGVVHNHGIFNMYGGKLTAKQYDGTHNNYYGCVVNYGTFYMYDGEISANNGPGRVENGAKFFMYGGKISGNTDIASGFGGVTNILYNGARGTVTLGGDVIIINNTDSSGKPCNFYIDADDTLLTIDSDNPLTGSAQIGVKTSIKPTEGNPVNITGVNSADYSHYFVSDDPDYIIVDGEDHRVQLVAKHSHSYDELTWKKDETNHWHECTCGDKKDEDAHSFGDWQFDADGHWTVCSVCGYSMTGNTHIYDSDNDMLCNICGYDRTSSDKQPPTGIIKIDTNSWASFLNKITFGLFFKEMKQVTIEAQDAGSGIDNTYYYISNAALSEQEVMALGDDDWNLGKSVSISPDKKCVVYAKLTDKAGNIAYISSDGMVFDATAPVISGVTDGAVYHTSQTVTVIDVNLDSVTVNNETVSLKENCFLLEEASGKQTIVATDKAGNTATVTVTMENLPPSHVHEYGTNWRSDGANHWHECVCGEKTDIATHMEDSGTVTKTPTETETGIKTYKCSACQKELRMEVIDKLPPSHTHEYSTDWKSDETSHWHECVCGEKTDIAAHMEDSGTVTKTPTETETGIKTYKCSACQKELRMEVIDKLPPSHTHEYSTDWKSDETDHWHVCDCGEKADISAHTEDSGTVTTPPTETKTGIRTYQCSVCGYQMRTESIPATGKGNQSGEEKAKNNEPKTGDSVPIEIYATLSMVAGFTYLLMYFGDRKRGMPEETKDELVSHLIKWAKRGGNIRRLLALAAIFVLLAYYHSIGKKTDVEWNAVYGE